MTIWRPRLVPDPSRGRGRRAAPLHQRLTDAIAADVAAGRLRPGQRLPTQRELADAVGTTVATVTRSYAEARRRGLVTATVGRGTFVRDAAARADSGPLDLTVNSLRPAPFLAELAASAAGLVDHDGLDALAAYQPHAGAERHRHAGAAWVRRRHVPAAAGDVVVTAGAQHAMLVALATLTRPRDVLLVEALTYPGLKSLANHLHVRLEPIALDAEGARPDALARAARRTGARVAYLMPVLQNPTGATAGQARRRALLDAAARAGVTIIEDDQYGFLSDAPPLAAEAPDRCCYICSLSKSVVPGIRVGFLRAPAELVPRLAAAVFASSVMAPAFTAELAARWIADGLADRIVAWKRQEFQARAVIARRVLDVRLPPHAPHAWVGLTGRITATDAVQQARLRGVLVSPATAFQAGRGAGEGLRVCLGPPASREALERGLTSLADVLRDPPRPHGGPI